MHLANKGHYHLQQNEGNQVEGMLKMIRSLAWGTALHWLPFVIISISFLRLGQQFYYHLQLSMIKTKIAEFDKPFV